MTKTKFKQTEIGEIPEDWEVKKIEECVKVNELIINKSFQHKYIEYIDIDSVDKGIITKTQLLRLDEAPSRAKRILRDNDIIISTVRPNLKHFAFIKKAKDNTIASTGFAVLTSKKINPNFLYYFITTDKFTNYLIAIADTHTSTYPSFNPDIIENSHCPFPPLPEQFAIAKILSDLDSKIELNQQMNKTLEAIGQAIFKHWFIDFEFPNEEGKPYKSSGGEMVYNEELGKEIPKGWEVKNIQDLLVFEKGVEPGSNYYTTENSENKIRFLRVGDVSSPDREKTFIPKELAEGKSCKEDDILLTLDATIGIVKIGLNGVHSGGVRKVFSKEKKFIPKLYIYSLLKSKEIQNIIYTYATGTTILHAGSSLDYICIPVPSEQIFLKFSEKTEPIYYKMVNNLIEIKILENIRDSLLPKLMSGKIRVPVDK